MPEHTSYFSYLIAMFPALGENMHNLGHSISGKAVGAHAAEPITAALFVALLVILMALAVRGKVVNHEASVIPDDKLTLRTVFEVLIGSFYNLMRDMMGAKRARRYFPIIGTCACFIFFSNLLGLIPGFMSPTGNLNITLGCSTVVSSRSTTTASRRTASATSSTWRAPFGGSGGSCSRSSSSRCASGR